MQEHRQCGQWLWSQRSSYIVTWWMMDAMTVLREGCSCTNLAWPILSLQIHISLHLVLVKCLLISWSWPHLSWTVQITWLVVPNKSVQPGYEDLWSSTQLSPIKVYWCHFTVWCFFFTYLYTVINPESGVEAMWYRVSWFHIYVGTIYIVPIQCVKCHMVHLIQYHSVWAHWGPLWNFELVHHVYEHS